MRNGNLIVRNGNLIVEREPNN
eukprot:COSAG01_NODE_4159_length_5281_cov_23.903816_7_plen_21_part_01